MNQNIIITSNEPWGDVWFSKQNYAYELSRKNKVIFINPPGKWGLSNLFGSNIRISKLSETLFVLEYNNILPIRSRWLYKFNNYLVSSALAKYFQRSNFTNMLMWAFDPNRLSSPRRLRVIKSFYHVVDPYNFKHYGEIDLCKNVDAILCYTAELAPQYSGFKKPLFIVPHGISEDEFFADPALKEAPEIEMEGYGLYIGSIDERINLPLLEEMLVKFPDTPFLFIGKFTFNDKQLNNSNFFTQKKYKNLWHYPPVQFKKLKYYIAKARFCLSINNIHSQKNVVSSHKLLQYLALGKPVFGYDFIQSKELKEIVYSHNKEASTLNQLSNFLTYGEPDDLAVKRIEYARTFTFERIFRNLEECMNSND